MRREPLQQAGGEGEGILVHARVVREQARRLLGVRLAPAPGGEMGDDEPDGSAWAEKAPAFAPVEDIDVGVDPMEPRRHVPWPGTVGGKPAEARLGQAQG